MTQVTGKQVLQKIGDAFEALAEAVREKLAGHGERFALMEARIAELESRKSLQYCGVWSAEHGIYPEHSLCTRGGSLWVSKCATHTAPPGDDWQLISKNNTR